MSKVKVKVTTHVTKEIEVDFPLYIKGGDVFDTGGGYDNWRRIDKDGTEYMVQVDHKDQWEYSVDKINLESSLAYFLIESKYDYSKIEAREFYDAVKRLRAALDLIPVVRFAGDAP